MYNEDKASHTESDSRDYLEAITASKKDPSELIYYLREVTFISLHAATHTTWHTLLSALSMFAIYPEVQQRAADEIQQEIGRGEVTTDSLDKLSYLKAVISETLRLYPAVPYPLRLTKRATVAGGFQLPRKITVLPLIISENMNPSRFVDPKAFRPERFLDDKGKFFHDPNLGTFSRGKRACPGREFSYMSSSIYLTKILQHFTVAPPSKNAKLSEIGADFFTSAGRLDELRFMRREGAPPIRDVQFDTRLSTIVREVIAAQGKKDI
ncbi:cytochrome P450 2F3 [Galendromus occidentalis]|uniref:Cytochrome P450 2F3 n=1 Tax=Galendromus occidentalis TaxID=34638 RepID=A0AAJ6VWC6_9ACAR|nr:cytochrome P450 2F3 [Galendromus occidentalis]